MDTNSQSFERIIITMEKQLDFVLSQIDENALEAINNIDSTQYSEQFAAPPTTSRFAKPKTDEEILKAQETGEPMTTARSTH